MKLTKEPRRTATVLSDGVVKIQDVDNIIKSHVEKTLIETAGPATPLSPDQIQATNLQLWILADDCAEADGDNIDTGEMVINTASQLESGNQFVVVGGSADATIEEDEVNVKKVYRWSSSADVAYGFRVISGGAAVQMKFLHDGSDFTILWVGKIRLASPSLVYLLFTNTNETSQTGISLRYDDAGGDSNALQFRIWNGSSVRVNVKAQELFAPAQYGFIIITGGSRSGNDYRVETSDGVSAGAEASGAFDSGSHTNPLTIGGDVAGGNNIDGDMATIAIWDALLTAAELDSLKAWIRNYYNISV